MIDIPAEAIIQLREESINAKNFKEGDCFVYTRTINSPNTMLRKGNGGQGSRRMNGGSILDGLNRLPYLSMDLTCCYHILGFGTI